MAESKRKYESGTMALPPLKFVLGDVPSPDPERKPRKRPSGAGRSQDRADLIARLIAHLKEK